jgi:hypothetical protein
VPYFITAFVRGIKNLFRRYDRADLSTEPKSADQVFNEVMSDPYTAGVRSGQGGGFTGGNFTGRL